MIKNPLQLEAEEREAFTRVLRSQDYQIITTIPTEDNYPILMEEFYRDPVTYQKILDDTNAYYHYFSMKFLDSRREEAIVPLGVYGITDEGKVRFPLLLDRYWTPFIRLSKNEFRLVCNIENAEECDQFYLRFLEVKNAFLYNIFKYYAQLDETYCSAMAWEKKDKSGNTRRIVTSVNFRLLEQDLHELYSSADISSEQWSYISKAYIRWGILGHTGLRGVEPSYNDPQKSHFFMRSLVNYQNN